MKYITRAISDQGVPITKTGKCPVRMPGNIADVIKSPVPVPLPCYTLLKNLFLY
jgi:hypothetical protein